MHPLRCEGQEQAEEEGEEVVPKINLHQIKHQSTDDLEMIVDLAATEIARREGVSVEDVYERLRKDSEEDQS